ncbi:MAG: hypothetical protein HN929_12835, partial [Chloroflexi bacterium]|nr:hypothetical protein [Chloroflexota bacterium]
RAAEEAAAKTAEEAAARAAEEAVARAAEEAAARAAEEAAAKTAEEAAARAAEEAAARAAEEAAARAAEEAAARAAELAIPPQVEITATTINENSGEVILTATLSKPFSSSVSFDYKTSDNTATAGNDYTASAGVVHIPAGVMAATFKILIAEDALDEHNETFAVEFSNITNQAILNSSNLELVVLDNDPVDSEISLQNAGAVTEGESLSFNVFLSKPSGKTVTIDYVTIPGTATSSEDFTSVSGTLTFAAGETSKVITVATVKDPTPENGTETFTLQLSNPVHATVKESAGESTVTINDAPNTPPEAVPDPENLNGGSRVWEGGENPEPGIGVPITFTGVEGIENYHLKFIGDTNGDGYEDAIALIFHSGASYPSKYVLLGQQSGWDGDIDLTNLGSHGYQLNLSAGPNMRYHLDGAGDLNGDGYADLLVSTWSNSGGNGYALVYGSDQGWGSGVDLTTMTTTTGAILNLSVPTGVDIYDASSIGDVDGDGFDDLLLNGWNQSTSEHAAYLLKGKSTEWDATIDLNAAPYQLGTLFSGDSVWWLNGPGDLNGDGFEDLIVDAESGKYLLYGGSSGWSSEIDLSSSDVAAKLNIVPESGYSGYGLNGRNVDVNGDGYADVVVSTYSRWLLSYSDQGHAEYLLYGRAAGWGEEIDLANLGTNGIKLFSEDFGSGGDHYIISGGDFNGDGYGEIVIQGYQHRINENAASIQVSADAGMLQNDFDADGDLLTIAAVNGVVDESSLVAGSYGTLSWAPDGSYTYSLNRSMSAVDALTYGDTLLDSFDYQISDGRGGISSSTLTVTIMGNNDAPTLTPGSIATTREALTGGVAVDAQQSNLLTGAEDVDDLSSSLMVARVNGAFENIGTGLTTALDYVDVYGNPQTQNVELTVHGDGSYSITAMDLSQLAPGTEAKGVFTYTVRDEDWAESSEQSAQITVSSINHQPLLDITKSPVLTTVQEDISAPVNGSITNSTLVSDLVNGTTLGNYSDLSDAITFKAWDQSLGMNGDVGVDTHIRPITQVGNFSSAGDTWDVMLSADGNTAYVSDGSYGLKIMDVSDPSNPLLKGSLDTAGSVRAVALSADGNTAYVADRYSGLQIVDVSDSSNPQPLAVFDTNERARNISLSADGNIVYVAVRSSGLQAINISDPANPALVGTFATDAHGVTLSADGGTAYVASVDSGLQIIDIRDPANLQLLGSFDTSGEAHDVVLSADGDTAYIADAGSGLQIIDVRDPANPLLQGSFDTSGRAYDVALSTDGSVVYVADNNSGLQVIDIRDPASPVLIEHFNTDGAAIGITLGVDGNLAYVADASVGLKILDVRDPTGEQSAFSSAVDTAEMMVVNVNDAPTIAVNNPVEVANGGSVTITNTNLNATDIDDEAAGLTYTITALPSSGALSLNGVALGQDDTFTQQDIHTGAVTYLHNGSDVDSDSFDFSLADGGEGGAVALSSTFNISPEPGWTRVVHEDFSHGNTGWNWGGVGSSWDATTMTPVGYSNEELGRLTTGWAKKVFDLNNEASTITFTFNRYDSWDGENFTIRLRWGEGDSYLDINESFNFTYPVENPISGTAIHGGKSVNYSFTPVDNVGNFAHNSSYSDQSFNVEIDLPANFADTLSFYVKSGLDQDVDDESYTIDDFSIWQQNVPTNAIYGGTFEDFENGVHTGWDASGNSNWTKTVTISDPAYGDALWFAESEPHKTYFIDNQETRIEFDFYQLDSWDSEYFYTYLNDTTLFSLQVDPNDITHNSVISGSTIIGRQDVTYSITPNSDLGDWTTNAGNTVERAAWLDQSFHIVLDIPKDFDESVELKFGTNLDYVSNYEAAIDESAAVDNIKVYSLENHAPILAVTEEVLLPSVLEDTGAPTIGSITDSTRVSELVNSSTLGNYSDADGDPAGIAITGVDPHVALWYTTNGGESWSELSGAVNQKSALLLAEDTNTRLYLKPSPDYSGTLDSAIQFRAWDQTSGSNGQTGVDTTPVKNFVHLDQFDAIRFTGSDGSSGGRDYGSWDYQTGLATDGIYLYTYISELGNQSVAPRITRWDMDGVYVDHHSFGTTGSYDPFGTGRGEMVYANGALYIRNSNGGTDTATDDKLFHVSLDDWSVTEITDNIDSTKPLMDTHGYIDGSLFSMPDGRLGIIGKYGSTDFNTVRLYNVSADGFSLTWGQDITLNDASWLNSIDYHGSTSDGRYLYVIDSPAGYHKTFELSSGEVVFDGSSTSLVTSDNVSEDTELNNATYLARDPITGAIHWVDFRGSHFGRSEPPTSEPNSAFSLAVDTAEITVIGTNDAPVLDQAETPTLSTISEDVGPPSSGSIADSTLVSDLINSNTLSNYSDADGDPAGIAVTGVNSNVTLWYSTDGGVGWTQLAGTAGETSALLLAADTNTRIYLQPDANFNGTLSDAISFKAWDQSAGSNGQTGA